MIVVADSSPLHYLVLVQAADILPALYTRVLAPQTVLDELRRAGVDPIQVLATYPKVGYNHDRWRSERFAFPNPPAGF